ncbi:hypothetical protein FHW18_005320 [Pigmentiphaga litoralis]|jgi:hypothetical protein|uniref:Uncharacterized protein n=1 Tax=Pigmentiphaga litoralis TaxID=516702 RepID=A0A7Y9IZV1_9BURK|nr:hypothetical protein [Pigmentiphaga litoralis]NYE86001.1 hypothetical protein [Pigmentiphaga litoralis]
MRKQSECYTYLVIHVAAGVRCEFYFKLRGET